MKKRNDHFKNRNRRHPTSSAASQPNASPRAPK